MLIWGNRSALGLFLGAWATNGLATFNPDAIFVSTLVGLGMASGSTLQAWFGATLVRPIVGRERDAPGDGVVLAAWLVAFATEDPSWDDAGP